MQSFLGRYTFSILSLSGTLLMLGLTGCTRPSDSAGGGATLSIALPQGAGSLSVGALQSQYQTQSSGGGSFGLPMPTSFNSLNCYYVFVGGPETSMSNNTCQMQSGGNFTFGVLAGPIAAGATASFQVPAGSNRSIYMGGYQTDGTLGGCPSLQNMQSIQSHISPPVFLGSVSGMNLSPDATVNVTVPVTATLQAANQIQNCSGAIAGGGNNNGGNFGGPMYTSGTGADGALGIASSSTYLTNTILGSHPFNAMSRISAINQTPGSQATSATLWSGGGAQFSVGQEVMISLIAANYTSTDTGNPSNNAFVNALAQKGPDSVCGGGWYRGKYIFTHIQGISGDTLTFQDPITTADPLNPYAISQPVLSGPNNFCDFRMVRVPNLSSLTLSSSTSFLQPPSAFDPTVSPASNVGLFVVFRVSGTLTGVSGGGGHNINADGLGFASTSGSYSGYSINGGNAFALSTTPVGAASFSPSGYGGGGANFGNAGADYNATDTASTAVGVGSWCSPCNLDDRVYAGGAGGSASATTGAPGGGIVIIFAHQFTNTGTAWWISADGKPSPTSTNGGAGAGGSVFLATNQLNTTSYLYLSANGGNAIASTYGGGAGGGGSAELSYCVNQNAVPTLTVTGGSACQAAPCTAGGLGNLPGGTGIVQSSQACNL